MGGSNGQSFDQIKRAFMDLVSELHSRKLAIPAGAVLVAILAAVFLLPKSPAPPAPATTAPVADQQKQVKPEAVVSLKLVGVSNLDNDTPISHSENPFKGSSKTKCVRVGNTVPKRYSCLIGDVLIRYQCLPDVTIGICGADEGASGATGSASAPVDGGSTPSTGTPGGGQPTPAPKKHVKTTYYEASVSIDGKTYTHVTAGDALPNDKNTLAIYAGANASAKKGIFIAGDGVTVSGVTVDEELGNFELSRGQTVQITDKDAVQHTLTFKTITKVTK